MPFKASGALKRIYDTYNRKFFDGQLPKDTIVGFNEWDPKECGLAVRHTEAGHSIYVIYIDATRHNGARDIRMTLLHEMAHIKLFPYPHHGKRFKEEQLRLAMRGALEGLW